MSFEGLQERLSALQETTASLKELIDRLANLKFQPGYVPLDTSEEGSVSGELSVEIGQLLRDGEEEKELLGEEVEYLRHDGHEKDRLREGVERQGQELQSCRTAFRKARLAAKKSLLQAQKLERELMVQSYSMPPSEATSPNPAADGKQSTQYFIPSRQRPAAQTSSLTEQDRQTVGASSRVTDSLRQMHASLQDELERSEYANRTMKESAEAFQKLNESYLSLDVMLSSSRDLLGTLLRSQKSDTWYLTTTFYMLVVVGGWLLFRRLIFGPMWYLVWLPLRFMFGIGSRVGSAALQGRSTVGGAGEQARADLPGASDAKIPVDGLPADDLPTAHVGGDEESVLKEVDKIVEAVKEVDELGGIPGDQVEQLAVHVEEERPRDEL